MSWHRVAILVVYGFLLQCTSNVNTSSQRQSYREALRRRLSTITCYPPQQQPPYIVVPYPYLQTNGQTPRVNNGRSKQISQNTQIAAGWPEYRIKLPLYRGRPIKTNIIIELPLSMFPGHVGSVNNAVSSSPSTPASNIECGEQVKVHYDDEISCEPSSTPLPNDCILPDAHGSSSPKEASGTLEGSDKSTQDNTSINDSSTDISEDLCNSGSPLPSIKPIENKPSGVESVDKSYSEQKNDCKVVDQHENLVSTQESQPNENNQNLVDEHTESVKDSATNIEDRDSSGTKPNETTLDSDSSGPECVENTPEYKPLPTTTSDLTTSNDPAVTNSDKISDDNNPTPNISEKETKILEEQDGGANEAKHSVDDPDCVPDPDKKELLETAINPEKEATATEDLAECDTSRTDNGTEIATASLAPSATSDD